MAKTPSGRASMIFKKWKSELANKDRTLDSVKTNFDELWRDVYVANIDFDTAYSILDDAVAAHAPSSSVVKFTYRRMKGMGFDSEKDFLDSWLGKIRAEATEAFHFYYPLEDQFKEEKKQAPSATINGIPRAEYSKQRRYIEQFPLMTVEEINEKHKEIEQEFMESGNDDGLFDFEDLIND